jgi:hypothetical protein
MSPIEETADRVAEAWKRLQPHLDHPRDVPEFHAAEREYTAAVLAHKDAQFAADLKASNERAAAERAAAESAAREREAQPTQPEKIPGKIGARWSSSPL